jgi:hypothetical protein
MSTDSCTSFDNFRQSADGVMSALLDAALAMKREQKIREDAEAFDYAVSFLSGVYRALALSVREPTLAAMAEAED